MTIKTTEENLRRVSVRSVTQLVEDAKASPRSLEGTLRALKGGDNRHLFNVVDTTTNPLVLWAAHVELDARGVPPCLRQRRVADCDQTKFITWLADVLWLVKRKPAHCPNFASWRGLFSGAPSPPWHNTARWVYTRSGSAHGHYYATALGLSDKQRQDLMTMPTRKMVKERALLAPWQPYKNQIEERAINFPDKGARVSPEEVTQRRMQILRAFLLAGRSPSRAVHYLALVTGRSITRQALSKQLHEIEVATGLKLSR